MALDPQLAALLGSLGVERPPVPSTMVGIECKADRETLLAVGDAREESGYNEDGYMTVCITTPTSQLGAILMDKQQVRQLRDFLSSKL